MTVGAQAKRTPTALSPAHKAARTRASRRGRPDGISGRQIGSAARAIASTAPRGGDASRGRHWRCCRSRGARVAKVCSRLRGRGARRKRVREACRRQGGATVLFVVAWRAVACVAGGREDCVSVRVKTVARRGGRRSAGVAGSICGITRFGASAGSNCVCLKAGCHDAERFASVASPFRSFATWH